MQMYLNVCLLNFHMEKNTYTKFNDEIETDAPVIDTDIKINPDYYIHHLLMKLQSAIIDNDIKVGFTKFFMLVEHLETIAESSGLLDIKNDEGQNYEDLIKKFKEEKNIDEENMTSRAKLANYKVKLITANLFSSRTIKGGLLIT